MGSCTKELINGDTSDCEGDVYTTERGQDRCITKKLENFEVTQDKLIWYGKKHDL